MGSPSPVGGSVEGLSELVMQVRQLDLQKDKTTTINEVKKKCATSKLVIQKSSTDSPLRCSPSNYGNRSHLEGALTSRPYMATTSLEHITLFKI